MQREEPILRVKSGGPTTPSSRRTSGPRPHPRARPPRARGVFPGPATAMAGVSLTGRLSLRMRVIIMGNGRVGSELSSALVAADHDVAVIDKNPEAFHAYPPGEGARQIVGLGFDRDVLEDSGIKDADGFVAVSSGDNSNIVSARVALEYYHVPRVIARIYDSRRAEIYERLNIP